jgi:hypothetical protein
MLPRHAEDLHFDIEHSPFSEAITFVIDESCLVDTGRTLPEVEMDCAFTGVDMEHAHEEYVIEYSHGAGLVGVWLFGLFDESSEKDDAAKTARRKPRVTVFRWPKAARAGTKVLVRGREFTAASFEKDANLGMVVWLR